MSEATSNFRGGDGGGVRRVFCPNCGVLANRFVARTGKNPSRAFHKCPFFAAGGCQYYQWEDEMGQCSEQQGQPLFPVPLQAVPAPPLQAAPTDAAMQAVCQPVPAHAAMEGNRVGERNIVVDDGVIQQLKWIEKLVFLCIFLALYAIFKK